MTGVSGVTGGAEKHQQLGPGYQQEHWPDIISEGDAIGSVIIVAKEGAKLGDLEVKLSETAAGFLGRQMEQ